MTARLAGLLERANARRARGQGYDDWSDDRLRARIEIIELAPALLARIAALESALEPFAREYKAAGVDHLPDDARFGEVDCDQGQLTVGHLRRAALNLKENDDVG